MADPELEAIRKQRMAQLQSQFKVNILENMYFLLLSNISGFLSKKKILFRILT